MRTHIAIISSLLLLVACGSEATTGEESDISEVADGFQTSDVSGETQEVPESCKPNGYALTKEDLCYQCNSEGNGFVGAPAPLDDQNPCTDEVCDLALGIVRTNNSATCDDGNPATWGDACVEGNCVGNDPLCDPGAFYSQEGNCYLCAPDGSGPSSQPQPIDDGNPCTDDSCTPQAGLKHLPNTDPCDDGDPDTFDDTCANTICAGQPLACTPGEYFKHEGNCLMCNEAGSGGQGVPISDGNVCTDDLCSSDSGLAHVNNTSACNDGNPNTVDDVCLDGACVGVPLVCAPGAWFEDGGLCWECADSGLTIEGEGKTIDDGNPCTDDLCHEDEGLLNQDNSSPCDDGDPDTVNDACALGICSGTVIACAKGEYLLQNGLCAQCNAAGTGTVDAGQSLDDDNPCTDGSCDLQNGVVPIANEALCDDGNAETAGDICSGGNCVGEPIICDPDSYYIVGNACYLCNALGTGAAAGGATIDDGNPCTNDGCHPDKGAVNEPNSHACDDGDANTTNDKCAEGICAGLAIVCPKGNYYLEDALCFLCNGDGTGPTGPGEVIPDDGNECTEDICDPGDGVYHHKLWGPLCDDGDPETGMDECQGGLCVGEPVICTAGTWLSNDDYACYLCIDEGTDLDDNGIKISDGNPCTDDGCDLAQGVVHSFNFAPCSDGNSNTVNDTCNGSGVCLGGAQVCPPGNYYQEGALCYLCDGDGAGPVGPGAPILDDGNDCTEDLCDAGTGVDHQELWGTPCDDGNAATAMDECDNGICVGEPVICTPGTWLSDDDYACYLCIDEGTDLDDNGVKISDSNSCTDDVCDAVDGVVHTALEGDCWDSNDCTTDDVCIAGECVGTPVQCNDYSPCTADSCDPESGCVYVQLQGPCDDGIALTLDDICIDGICIGMVDPDGDGIPNYGVGGPCDGPGNLNNCLDNCPYRANANQVDSDNDGQGDACETPRWWTRVDTTEKVVALTFDDGWSKDAFEGLLKALGEKGARASFFISGVYMEDGVLDATVIQQAINGGHVVGNHTYSHSVGSNLAETVAEILQASVTFKNLVGDDLRPIYRHPYANLVPWINIALVQTGFLESVLGNFDSEDWLDPEPDAQLLADCIVAMAGPGDIIGFHVGPATTVAALPAIIDGLHAKGYTLLNIEQMMAYGPPVIIDESEVKTCGTYWDNL